MEMVKIDYKKFVIRTVVSIAGAILSYMTTTTPENFAITFVVWIIIQTVLSSLATVTPEEISRKTGKVVEIHPIRKFLSEI